MKDNKLRKLRKVRFALSFIVLILWMLFIFGMSAKSGEESAGISYRFAVVLYKLPPVNRIFGFGIFHTLIRKLAHFTEYGILSLLVINFINACGRRIRKTVVAGTLVFCVIYAGIDEYHQSFVAGRGPSVRDVMIDAAGAVFFLGIFMVVSNMVRKN